MNRNCPRCVTPLVLSMTSEDYGIWHCPECGYRKDTCGAMIRPMGTVRSHVCLDLDRHSRPVHECGECGETWMKSINELAPKARPKEEW